MSFAGSAAEGVPEVLFTGQVNASVAGVVAGD